MIYFIIIMMIVFILFMIFKAHHDVIEYRSIIDSRLPEDFDNYRVFFISDIHRRKINPNILKTIREEIHMVVIGGDLTEKGVPLERTRHNLRILQQYDAPIYFVWGNNDYEIDTDQLHYIFHEENIIVLKDSYTIVARNSHKINVIGFDYHKDEDQRKEMNWEQMEGSYTLLLTHVPHSFYELDQSIRNSIHTVLAGHTHGGQIRLFGIGLYQRGGLHVFEQTNVFVSEGYGYTFLPFRLQTDAECHVLTLKKQT